MGFVSTYTNQTSEGELTKHSVLRAQGKGGRSYKSLKATWPNPLFSIGLKDKALRLNYSLCFSRVKDSYAAWSLGCSHSKEKLSLWVTTKNFHNKESQTQWLCKLMRCPHNRAQSDESLLTALSLIGRMRFYATGRSALKTRRVWIRSSKYAHSPNRQFLLSWTYLVQFYL